MLAMLLPSCEFVRTTVSRGLLPAILGAWLVPALMGGMTARAQVADTRYAATSEELAQVLAETTTGEVTIRLLPGATYVGPFVVKHVGPGVLTITTDGTLPEPGYRVAPSDKPGLAVIESSSVSPALWIFPGSSHVDLVGVALNGAASWEVLRVGSGSGEYQASIDLVPHHIRVDRVLIDGGNTGLNKRGISLHGADVVIENSHVDGIWRDGQDSQAIGGWNGVGRYTIRNNFLEAASENIMFGGADPAITNLVAEDILILGNHLYKRREWLTLAYTGINVKNLLELKAARRVTIRGNVMDGSWRDGQGGIGVLFKTVNQSGGCTACVTEDVLFEDNIVQNVGAGVSVSGSDYLQVAGTTSRVTIHNNLFLIDGPTYGGSGRFLSLSNGPQYVVVERNTAVFTGDAYITASRGNRMTSGGQVEADLIAGFNFNGNLMRAGLYGAFVEGYTSSGLGWGAVFAPDLTIIDNVLAGMSTTQQERYWWPNLYPTETDFWDSFVDPTNGDYRLKEGAFGYAAVGVDFSRLPAATSPEPEPTEPQLADPAPESIAILTSSLPDGMFGQPYVATLEADRVVTWRIVSGSLPRGLTLSSDGVIAGAGELPGKSTFVVEASHGTTSSQAELSIRVHRK
jgi:hypothetical protein